MTVVSDRIARALTGLGLLELYQLIYEGLSTGFGMFVFFIEVGFIVFQIRHLALFLLIIFFKLLRLTFSSKLDWPLILSLLLKLPPKMLEL